ncbi:MAG: PGPGW domain-containing protein [Myxococcota bacterium]
MTRLAREVWRQAWRAGVAIAGCVLVVAGVVMLVLPGPGIVTILAGLGLLALEFDAARDLRDRLAGRVRARAQRTAAKANVAARKADA